MLTFKTVCEHVKQKVSITANISERMKGLRKRLDWSQDDLAKALEVSRNYVSMIEGGREPGKNFARAFDELEARTHASEQTPTRPQPRTPREKLAFALTKRGLSISQLAKLIHYDAGILRNVIEGSGRISEKMAEAIVREFPELTKEDLLDGSEHVRILSEDGMHDTYGAKPSIVLPPGVKGKMVPLLSMAQAGGWDAGHTDDGWSGECVFALNVDDRRAFAIKVVGNSMEPEIREGDIVICSPDRRPENGECAVVRTRSEQAFVKFWRTKGHDAVLESANPDFKPLIFPLAEIAGAFLVVQRIAAGKITKQL